MSSDVLFVTLPIIWFLARMWLWRLSNKSASTRLSQGEEELAKSQTSKQPLIYLAVFIVIVIEVLRVDRASNPLVVYLGLVVWCLGLAFLIRDLEASRARWTCRIFRSGSESGNSSPPSEFTQMPWIPWWSLRLETVGLALFCGASVGALVAWLFCVAYGRGVHSAIFEQKEQVDE